VAKKHRHCPLPTVHDAASPFPVGCAKTKSIANDVVWLFVRSVAIVLHDWFSGVLQTSKPKSVPIAIVVPQKRTI